jgi:3-carboxy-cis,cis-muconate cycloisomerase
MQFEVGEVHERGGGSSTMPHKRNPVGSATVLAAAARMPGLVSTMLAGLVQEHERAAGAWHAELPVVADALQTMGAAAAAMGDTAGSLTVDPARMRANIDRTNGAIVAERAVMQAGSAIGRDRAHGLITQALARSRARGESLGRAVRDTPEIAGVLTADDLRALDEIDTYLGMAETFRRRLLASVDREHL